MANERLRAALEQAGLIPDQLASLADVDVKTVNRWLAGQTMPHARHRARVAQALGAPEHELWPRAAQDEVGDLRREIIGAWRDTPPGDAVSPPIDSRSSIYIPLHP